MSLFKKGVGLCIVVLFSFFTMSFNGMAISEMPSFWAIEKVNLATNEGLVPDELSGRYHKNITRGQYAEMIVNAYMKTRKSYSVNITNPFSDIGKSKNLKALIEAYNLGLIKGYGDGTFKPDESITREQIAVLLTKLVNLIDSNINTAPISNYDFVDKKVISNWALPMVTYCYESGIMKGSDYLKISPKDNTTCEQAIILIYNLVEKFGIIKKSYSYNKDLEKNITGNENLTEFEKNVGVNNSTVVKSVLSDLPKNPYFESAYILPDAVKIYFLNGEDKTGIVVSDIIDKKSTKFISKRFDTMYPSNQDYIKIYLQLLSNSNYSSRVIEALNKAINEARESYNITPVELNFGEDEYFKIYQVAHVRGEIFCFELREIQK